MFQSLTLFCISLWNSIWIFYSFLDKYFFTQRVSLPSYMEGQLCFLSCLSRWGYRSIFLVLALVFNHVLWLIRALRRWDATVPFAWWFRVAWLALCIAGEPTVKNARQVNDPAPHSMTFVLNYNPSCILNSATYRWCIGLLCEPGTPYIPEELALNSIHSPLCAPSQCIEKEWLEGNWFLNSKWRNSIWPETGKESYRQGRGSKVWQLQQVEGNGPIWWRFTR